MKHRWNKLTFLLLVTICISTQVYAQRDFGVTWDIPGDSSAVDKELTLFKKAGIAFIEVEEIPDSAIVGKIRERGFILYITAPVRFPVVQTLAEPDSSVTAVYRQLLSLALRGEPAGAIGIFSYGQTRHESFVEAISRITREIRENTDIQLYYRSGSAESSTVDSLFDFRIVDMKVTPEFNNLPDTLFQQAEAFSFNPVPALDPMITPFKWFLEKLSINRDAILFMNDDWLINAQSAYPQISRILSEYARSPDAVFPLPEEQFITSYSHNWIILILLILWGSFAATYNFEPTYRKSLPRYFVGHKFFVDDIVNRQIRPVLPTVVILLQHALVGGIFLYSTSYALFSQRGMTALLHHIPWLGLLGEQYMGIFRTGTLLTFGFEVLCLAWLYFISREVKYFSQVATLYAWPLQLNLFVVTIMVTLLMTHHLQIFLIPAGILFLIIMLSAFLMTAFDTVKFLKSHPNWYITGTVGIYMILICGFIIYLATNAYFINVLKLALALP